MKPITAMTEFELRYYIAHLEDRMKLAYKRASDYSNMRRAKSAYHTLERLRSELARCKRQLKTFK